MWNIISKLWDTDNIKYDIQSLIEENDINKKNENSIDFILNDNSPRISGPKNDVIRLWPHQEAMLYRINQIEKKGYLCKTEHTDGAIARYMDKRDAPKSYDTCLGVMNDPPGSGKTYAILTHILMDSTPGPTLIIVPQNIYAQWREAIQLIFVNHSDVCNFSSSYVDIMNIYGNPSKINSYKVILLLDNFAEAYLKVINDNKLSICRIIVDEIDIMDKFICSSVNSRYVWLMSASYKDQKRLGPYYIGDHTQVVCKCDSKFVEQSLNLPDPINQIIRCDDDHIQIFKEILDGKQINALNAGDHQILNRIMNISGLITPVSYHESAKKYAEYLLKKSELLDDLEKEFDTFVINSENEKEYNLLRDRVTLLRRYRNQSNLITTKLESLADISTLQYKEKYLENDIVEKMLEDKTSKWLIFNDNGNVLVKYQSFLQTKEIKSLMLDGGNQKLIEKTIKDYKEGDVQVLLLNSMIEGAGMNLENTTHLLFMHKTEEKFIEQVMGRAQRFGRKLPLNIIMLFNKNE